MHLACLAHVASVSGSCADGQPPSHALETLACIIFCDVTSTSCRIRSCIFSFFVWCHIVRLSSCISIHCHLFGRAAVTCPVQCLAACDGLPLGLATAYLPCSLFSNRWRCSSVQSFEPGSNKSSFHSSATFAGRPAVVFGTVGVYRLPI